MSTICLPELGAMPMPPAFRYRDVLTRGRNAHPLSDGFFAKHPPMPVSRWAKIFAPFDALSGFDEALSAKEVVYTVRQVLDAEAETELNRRLEILSRLAVNGRLARRSRALVEVTAFVPCADPNHAAFGRGFYDTIEGFENRSQEECRALGVNDSVPSRSARMASL